MDRAAATDLLQLPVADGTKRSEQRAKIGLRNSPWTPQTG
jgi:hypothetical protein